MSENKLTPMQEHYELLVWWRDETIKKKHAVPEDIEYYDGMIWAFELLMNSIEVKGLEKEKGVIITSHINGQSEFDTGARSIKNDKLAEQYYNKTFNTNDVK